jgi:hypothetical protein
LADLIDNGEFSHRLFEYTSRSQRDHLESRSSAIFDTPQLF